MSFFLPVIGGDQVRVQPSGARGEVVGWAVTGRRLGVELVYRIHLANAPSEEEIEVDARELVPQPRI